MIVADENIDHSLIEAIRLAGIEVVSVYEEARGISDFSVIEIARNPPRIILTEDKDFGEWIFAHQVKDIICRVDTIRIQRNRSYQKKYYSDVK